jgi:hypothetical protein
MIIAMKEQILKLLEENGMVEMEREDSLLTIWFRKFFGTKKEFNFQLNAKSVDGCKTKKTALKKIDGFINKGFVLCKN